MRESSQPLAGLRRRIARLATDGGSASLPAEGRLASGHAGFDAALGGGLAIGKTHEFFAADALDGTSAAAFAALLALRTPGKAPLIWLRSADAAGRSGHIYAPGIAELGGDILELSQTLVSDYFTMILIVDTATLTLPLELSALGAVVLPVPVVPPSLAFLSARLP